MVRNPAQWATGAGRKAAGDSAEQIDDKLVTMMNKANVWKRIANDRTAYDWMTYPSCSGSGIYIYKRMPSGQRGKRKRATCVATRGHVKQLAKFRPLMERVCPSPDFCASSSHKHLRFHHRPFTQQASPAPANISKLLPTNTTPSRVRT